MEVEWRGCCLEAVVIMLLRDNGGLNYVNCIQRGGVSGGWILDICLKVIE